VPDDALGQGDHGPDRLSQRAQVADTLGKFTPQIHQDIFRRQMVEDLAIELAKCSDDLIQFAELNPHFWDEGRLDELSSIWFGGIVDADGDNVLISRRGDGSLKFEV